MGRHPLTAVPARAARARLADGGLLGAYPDRVQILWWLAPPVVATVLAILWVSWLGRAGRGHVDPEVAVRRLGDAMAKATRAPRTTPTGRGSPQERSTGVAVRPSTRSAGDTRRAS